MAASLMSSVLWLVKRLLFSASRLSSVLALDDQDPITRRSLRGHLDVAWDEDWKRTR